MAIPGFGEAPPDDVPDHRPTSRTTMAANLSAATRRRLTIADRSCAYFSLSALEAAGLGPVGSLPVSLKVLLENLLRHEDGATVTQDDIAALAAWRPDRRP